MFFKHFACSECEYYNIEENKCEKDHTFEFENIIVPVKECCDFEPMELK